MDKPTRAIELCDKAQKLADLNGSNQVAMGIIALEVKADPELVLLSGCKSYGEWMKKNFGKKRTTALRWRHIVEKLLDRFATSDELLALGSVKAGELARLPESQLSTGEWQKKAQEMGATDFSRAVASFLADKPDHMEQTFWLHVAMPESFRPIMELAFAAAKQLAEADAVELGSKAQLVEYVFAQFIGQVQGEVDLSLVKEDAAKALGEEE